MFLTPGTGTRLVAVFLRASGPGGVLEYFPHNLRSQPTSCSASPSDGSACEEAPDRVMVVVSGGPVGPSLESDVGQGGDIMQPLPDL
jgi:hypothetical protein